MNKFLLEKCADFLKKIPDNLNYITPEKLNNLLAEEPDSIYILDIRTPEAYTISHIPGSINIWMKDLLDEKNFESLPKSKLIVVCCWVGHTASQILTILQLLGFNAIGLKYGMGVPINPNEPKLGWLDYGYPTCTGN